MAGGTDACRVVGDTGEFASGAHETAAAPVAVPGVGFHLRKDALDLLSRGCCRPISDALIAPQCRQVAGVEIGGNEIVFAFEVVIERALGNAGSKRHGIHPHGLDAVAVKQLVGRLHQAAPCLG